MRFLIFKQSHQTYNPMKKRSNRFKLGFDRLLSQGEWKQLGVLFIILVVFFVLSFVLLNQFGGNDWKQYCDEKNISRWLFPLYLLIDGNAFNDLYTNGDIPISKATLIISGLSFMAGILLFTGALISIMTNLISRRVEDYKGGMIHYLKSGHYIIMGFDDMVPSIINEIFKKDPEAYVLMLSAVNAETINEKLCKSFSENELKHIIINYGQRTSEECYGNIHLESASEIYIVGNRSLPAHDAMNVECVNHICDYLKKTKKEKGDILPSRITCIFEDLDTYAAFKTSEIFDEVRALGIDFVPYNFYSGWAKQVFVDQFYREKNNPGAKIAYPSVYGGGIKPDDKKRVHLVFIGTTNFGVAFAMEAAHMLHFPNFDESTKRPKTLITFIEKNAETEMAQFITRNRHFFEVQSYYYHDLTTDAIADSEPRHDLLTQGLSSHDFLDVEFEFIKGDIYSKQVQDKIKGWAADNGQYLSIFLTLTDQRGNFMMGMNMPDEVYSHKIPVFIRQDRADNFVTKLRGADSQDFVYSIAEGDKLKSEQRQGRYANLYPFGMDDTAYCSNDRTYKQAMLINYLYSTADYQQYKFTDLEALDAIGRETIWKEAKEKWQELPVALRWSSLYSAYNFTCKLASLRAIRGLDANDTSHDLDELTQAELDVFGHVEHNRWNVEKLLMGYRKALPEEDKYEHPAFEGAMKKNKKLFIHHDIRPFDELDIVKELDYEIVKYMPWMLKMTE